MCIIIQKVSHHSPTSRYIDPGSQPPTIKIIETPILDDEISLLKIVDLLKTPEFYGVRISRVNKPTKKKQWNKSRKEIQTIRKPKKHKNSPPKPKTKLIYDGKI